MTEEEKQEEEGSEVAGGTMPPHSTHHRSKVTSRGQICISWARGGVRRWRVRQWQLMIEVEWRVGKAKDPSDKCPHEGEQRRGEKRNVWLPPFIFLAVCRTVILSWYQQCLLTQTHFERRVEETLVLPLGRRSGFLFVARMQPPGGKCDPSSRSLQLDCLDSTRSTHEKPDEQMQREKLLYKWPHSTHYVKR